MTITRCIGSFAIKFADAAHNRYSESRQSHEAFLTRLAGNWHLAVLPMVFVALPFQAPDEAQHYFRAYQSSEGTMLAEVHNGMSGGTLPTSLQTFATNFLGPDLLNAFRPVPRHRSRAPWRYQASRWM